MNKVATLGRMVLGAVLIALCFSACGEGRQDVVATQLPATTVQYKLVTVTPGDIQSFWAEKIGPKIESTGFVADISVDGPLYGPRPMAHNFDAAARVGTECVAVFVEGMPGSDESLTTHLYIEKGSTIEEWAARDGTEATSEGANRLIANFSTQCVEAM